MHKRKEEKYFLQQYLQVTYLHGGAGGTDAERVLLEKGFKPVLFPHQQNFSIAAKLSRLIFLVKTFFRIKSGDIVFFISPVYARLNRLVLKLLRLKNVTLVCILADIEGLRDGNNKVLAGEIRQYRDYSHFILHNDQMAAYLRKYIPHAFFCTLEFFDFLVPAFEKKQRQKSFDILFAANLEKSSFLYQLNRLKTASPHLVFHLYGPGITGNVSGQENVKYHGFFKPYDLPPLVEGAFGLIWDGESIDTCSGSYGEYLRYNSQHKLSLYILCLLPVIVWEEAATAELVKTYGIGFTIKNLYELEGKINALSEAEYRQMQANMLPLAEKISRGECLGNAIDEILKQV